MKCLQCKCGEWFYDDDETQALCYKCRPSSCSSPSACSVRSVIGDVLNFEDEDNGRIVVTVRLKGTMAERFLQADPALVQLAFGTPNAGGEFRRDSDVNSTALLADSESGGKA